MQLPRRRFLHLAASAAGLPAVSRIARAQTYPTRPVHIIVGFAPGGGADITARLMGQWLSERLGQQFIIENRQGAGSNIGTEAVAKAGADGYTLLLVTTANAINATLYDKLNFDFARDIASVAQQGDQRWPRRPQARGAACGSGRHGACGLTRRRRIARLLWDQPRTHALQQ
jgi:tripartite-type tricarboxylate transporter receptor subunit TctC